MHVLLKIILVWSREFQGHVDILALSNKLSKLPDVRYHHPKQIKIQKPGRTQSDLYILDMHIDALDIHLDRKLFLNFLLRKFLRILRNFQEFLNNFKGVRVAYNTALNKMLWFFRFSCFLEKFFLGEKNVVFSDFRSTSGFIHDYVKSSILTSALEQKSSHTRLFSPTKASEQN